MYVVGNKILWYNIYAARIAAGEDIFLATLITSTGAAVSSGTSLQGVHSHG